MRSCADEFVPVFTMPENWLSPRSSKMLTDAGCSQQVGLYRTISLPKQTTHDYLLIGRGVITENFPVNPNVMTITLSPGCFTKTAINNDPHFPINDVVSHPSATAELYFFYCRPIDLCIVTIQLLFVTCIYNTSCNYPSSGRSCLGPGLCQSDLSRFALEFSRPLRASVRSFINIRQVSPNDLD